MDFKELAENLGLEDDEIREIVELFLETCAVDLRKLRSAMDEGDTQQVAKAAHSIKGAAGNLGFIEVFETAKEIEEKAGNDRLEGMAESAQVLKKRLDVIAEVAAGLWGQTAAP